MVIYEDAANTIISAVCFIHHFGSRRLIPPSRMDVLPYSEEIRLLRMEHALKEPSFLFGRRGDTKSMLHKHD